MSSSVSSKYEAIIHGSAMSNPNESTQQVNRLANIAIEVVVQPPQNIMTNYNLRTAAVVKLGPLPSNMSPEDIQGGITLLYSDTGKPVEEVNNVKAFTGQGQAVTGAAIKDKYDTAYFLFHSLQIPKAGRYYFGVFLLDWRTSSGKQVRTRDFVVSSDVAGSETHTAEEKKVINELRRVKVLGSA